MKLLRLNPVPLPYATDPRATNTAPAKRASPVDRWYHVVRLGRAKRKILPHNHRKSMTFDRHELPPHRPPGRQVVNGLPARTSYLSSRPRRVWINPGCLAVTPPTLHGLPLWLKSIAWLTPLPAVRMVKAHSEACRFWQLAAGPLGRM